MLQFCNISKRFGGVQALQDVSLTMEAGECHGLMGENGAGKSTLGKILAGIPQPDEGEVRLNGRTLALHSPAAALAAGIGMVQQELAFCPDLSVAENLCLGRLPARFGILRDRRAMRRQACDLLGRIGADLDVDQPMAQLSTAQEQFVQIAAAVGVGASILIFDEPTSSLSELDARRLFALIATLKASGLTCLYVTHRMAEVQRLCDRVSVLRDGCFIGTLPHGAVEEEKIIEMMVGRHVAIVRRREHTRPAPGSSTTLPALDVCNLSSPGIFNAISFRVAPGEIVGLAGLVGAGRSEIAKAIFGLDRRATGEVRVAGQPLPRHSPRRAMTAGIGLVPEDRKRQGLILSMSCRRNFALANFDRLSRFGFLQATRERALATCYFRQLDVRAASLDAPVGSLSGGTQQKVVLARWLARGGQVFIVDEPTRGVDVGAKAAIHELLLTLAAQGLAILLISSELIELLNLADRILILREGRLVGETPARAVTQDLLLRMMSGLD